MPLTFRSIVRIKWIWFAILAVCVALWFVNPPNSCRLPGYSVNEPGGFQDSLRLELCQHLTPGLYDVQRTVDSSGAEGRWSFHDCPEDPSAACALTSSGERELLTQLCVEPDMGGNGDLLVRMKLRCLDSNNNALAHPCIAEIGPAVATWVDDECPAYLTE